jgi:hypothetical protein
MTDGPFKNAPLPSYWQDYGDSVAYDAHSKEDCSAKAFYAVLRDLDPIRPIVKDLLDYAAKPDLFPEIAITKIFKGHPPSQPADILQSHISLHLKQQGSVLTALTIALSGMVSEQTSIASGRLYEEGLHLRDREKILRENFPRFAERHKEAFGSIQQSDICDDLLSGNAKASKDRIQKKTDLDDGPEL